MGYAGEESMYVSRAVLDAAYADAGLALDFYKSCLRQEPGIVCSMSCLSVWQRARFDRCLWLRH